MAKVLVAIDGSEVANEAALRAKSLFGSGSDFIVLEAVHVPLPVLTLVGPTSTYLPVPATEDLLAASEIVETEARADVAAVAHRLGGSPRERVEVGDAGEVVCHVAAEEHADVIVVGSHGKGWARRAVMGSVSSFVVQHAPCPVLVVRADGLVGDTD
jgi:nucleotide-binding universal stress UspA family protein